MRKFSKISQIIKEELTNKPELRDDDFLLVLDIYSMLVDTKAPFSEIMKNHYNYNLPPFETVRRCRAKVQELYPELASSDKVKRGRTKLIIDYKELAHQYEV